MGKQIARRVYTNGRQLISISACCRAPRQARSTRKLEAIGSAVVPCSSEFVSAVPAGVLELRSESIARSQGMLAHSARQTRKCLFAETRAYHHELSVSSATRKLSRSRDHRFSPGKSASRQRSVGTASAFIVTNPEPPTLVFECDFFVQFWRTRKGPNQFADAMRDAE